MDLWIPLNGRNQTTNVEYSWASGLCQTPTGARTEDCLFACCCTACAFSEEYAYIDNLINKQPMPHGCEKYCNLCACCLFCLFSSLNIPCGPFCWYRKEYRKKFKIRGGECGDLMATFLFCCCAHAQVDLSAAAALSPAAPAARPLITSVPLTHATTNRLWTT
jgi:Cys-rich protein (TIGR01571 family)